MNKDKLTILAIESSCDETAAAIYSTDKKIESNIIYSQLELHKKFGGVIPEAASRSHLEKINEIVLAALEKANKKLEQIDAIAITSKPGLPGSLLVGVCFGKALAWAKNIKLIGVNHLEGHVFSACIENDIPFPFLCITASGGHTALYLVKDFGEYEVIGQTTDDAAGEAFDKCAKLLGLDYPGGPEIEKLATENNFIDNHKFPRGKQNNLDFSFSGLKTAVLYYLVDKGFLNVKDKFPTKPIDLETKKSVSSSLLVCIADIFEKKLNLALKKYPEVKAIAFVGGVACNKYIKQRLATFANKKKLQFFTPSAQYCTDNAGMIAFVGHYKALQNRFDSFDLDIY